MSEKALAIYKTSEGVNLANEAISLVVNGNSSADIRKFFSKASSESAKRPFGKKHKLDKHQVKQKKRTLADLRELVDDIRYGMEEIPSEEIDDIIVRLNSEPTPNFLSESEEETYYNLIDSRADIIKLLWGCEYPWKQESYRMYSLFLARIIGLSKDSVVNEQSSFGWLNGETVEEKTKHLREIFASTIISELYDRSLLTIPFGHNLDKTQSETEEIIKLTLSKCLVIGDISAKEIGRIERILWKKGEWTHKTASFLVSEVWENLSIRNRNAELNENVKTEIAAGVAEILETLHKECLRQTALWYYGKASEGMYTKILASFAVKHVPFGCLDDSEITESQHRAIETIEKKISEILPIYMVVPEKLEDIQEAMGAGSVIKISNEFLDHIAKIIVSATDTHKTDVETFMSGMKQNIDNTKRKSKNYFTDISNGKIAFNSAVSPTKQETAA